METTITQDLGHFGEIELNVHYEIYNDTVDRDFPESDYAVAHDIEPIFTDETLEEQIEILDYIKDNIDAIKEDALNEIYDN